MEVHPRETIIAGIPTCLCVSCSYGWCPWQRRFSPELCSGGNAVHGDARWRTRWAIGSHGKVNGESKTTTPQRTGTSAPPSSRIRRGKARRLLRKTGRHTVPRHLRAKSSKQRKHSKKQPPISESAEETEGIWGRQSATEKGRAVLSVMQSMASMPSPGVWGGKRPLRQVATQGKAEGKAFFGNRTGFEGLEVAKSG